MTVGELFLRLARYPNDTPVLIETSLNVGTPGAPDPDAIEFYRIRSAGDSWKMGVVTIKAFRNETTTPDKEV